jgi:hypothetical protein
MTARLVIAVLVGAALCAIGALILGEYEFSGLMPYAAGVLFGLVVAEVVTEISKRRTVALTVVSAVLVAGGLLWAAWISSGEGLRPLPAAAWAAVVLGVAAVVARSAPRRSRGATHNTTPVTDGPRRP